MDQTYSLNFVNWDSAANQLLLNPRMPKEQMLRLQKILEECNWLKGHIWLCSSGSTSTASDQNKLIALSKEAILVSARAVNQFLNSTARDTWVNPLPVFHVGGLSIHARAFLSGAKLSVYSDKWDVKSFYELLKAANATLTSLVPAQVFDLVRAQLKAPDSIRAAVVGGGFLEQKLYLEAKALGWQLLPSYGMTECSSQIATAIPDSRELKILPHVELKIDQGGRICIKSEALLTTYAIETSTGFSYIDPKINGWLQTSDLGRISNGYLEILGREGDFIKVGGESVELIRLDQILERIKIEQSVAFDLALIPFPDSRLGHLIHLVVATDADNEAVQRLVDSFHAQVLPFERIRNIHKGVSIPRSPLGKLLRKRLIEQLIKRL
jgi:O-succinylbenzoic acid--CoA ligase